ncbi:MAG TPA: AraC family transcriptional regulator [Segetibacter sp.]|jgi:AraC-like DNA-binding protein|nr:AraC family transcriptional regulator [Segetibacter sp.]
MKLVEIRLTKEPDKSFIFYNENAPFAKWHNHPEYELVLITKGWGRRSIGDHIDNFEPGDIAFIGPYVPHEYVCDQNCYNDLTNIQSECIVIQFDHTFLGEQFFKLPENKCLLKIFSDAKHGLKLKKESGEKIEEIMIMMVKMNDTERLYALFNIFSLFSKNLRYELLSSPQFVTTFLSDENEVVNKVVQYMMQNFQKDIRINDLLDIAHMSNSSFCNLFKATYRMTFKDYLLKIRIGYACRLLIENNKSISEIAYKSGFENISNFNRQFKKIKKLTPKEYRSQLFQS